jgi:hypothetical protein
MTARQEQPILQFFNGEQRHSAEKVELLELCSNIEWSSLLRGLFDCIRLSPKRPKPDNEKRAIAEPAKKSVTGTER